MDEGKVPRALSVGKTLGFPIHHYVMRHVHTPIANGKKTNRYQKGLTVVNFHK